LRCGLVHGYKPKACYVSVEPGDSRFHLKWKNWAEKQFILHVPELLTNLLGAVESYAEALNEEGSGAGTLKAYRKGWEGLEGRARHNIKSVPERTPSNGPDDSSVQEGAA